MEQEMDPKGLSDMETGKGVSGFHVHGHGYEAAHQGDIGDDGRGPAWIGIVHKCLKFFFIVWQQQLVIVADDPIYLSQKFAAQEHGVLGSGNYVPLPKGIGGPGVEESKVGQIARVPTGLLQPKAGTAPAEQGNAQLKAKELVQGAKGGFKAEGTIQGVVEF